MSLAHREPSARRPLTLEVLEDRIAPAGGVTTILSHGTLTITGDALANDIVIDQAGLAPGEFRIASGADVTAVNGQAEDIIQGVTGSIVLKLGDGDDAVQFDAVDVAKSLSFDGGTGTNTFDLAGGSSVGGSLWVTNGQSTNIADAAVTGSVKILNSAGPGTIVIDGLSARGLAITTGRGFDGNIIDLDNLSLTGALKILDRSSGVCRTDLTVADIASVRTVNGQGDFLLYADGLTCTSTGLSVSTHNNTWTSIDAGAISGSMSVRGGVFGGGVYLDNTTIAKGVNVVNSFQGLFVGGFSFTADNCDLGIDTVNHKNYSVRVSVGFNDGLVDLTDVNIGRSLAVSYYAGGSLYANRVSIGGSLSLRAGSFLSSSCVVSTADVAGATTILTGSREDSVKIDDSSFAGPVTISTRAGADSISIEANGDPAGPVSTFAHSVKIIAGDGDDTVVLGVAGESGNHGDYLAAVLLDGGNGFDTLTLPDGANTFAATPVPKAFEATNT